VPSSVMFTDDASESKIFYSNFNKSYYGFEVIKVHLHCKVLLNCRRNIMIFYLKLYFHVKPYKNVTSLFQNVANSN
jgi:hypothetical protein